MKKSELKAGYIVEVRNSINSNFGMLMQVEEYKEMNICRHDDFGISNLENYNDDLTHQRDSSYDIMRVWGFSNIMNALIVSAEGRELLYDRDNENIRGYFDIRKYLAAEKKENNLSDSQLYNTYMAYNWPKECHGLRITKDSAVLDEKGKHNGYASSKSWESEYKPEPFTKEEEYQLFAASEKEKEERKFIMQGLKEIETYLEKYSREEIERILELIVETKRHKVCK